MSDYQPYQYREIISDLRARLAEVEAERDRLNDLGQQMTIGLGRAAQERDDALARLAAVEALCQRNFNMEDWYEIDANDVIAAARGEGDRGWHVLP